MRAHDSVRQQGVPPVAGAEIRKHSRHETHETHVADRGHMTPSPLRLTDTGCKQGAPKYSTIHHCTVLVTVLYLPLYLLRLTDTGHCKKGAQQSVQYYTSLYSIDHCTCRG